MARAMWKACLELGALRVPVKLYAGVEDRDVHFRLLHGEDQAPVVQRMVDPRDEREVPAEEIRRGLELEEGVFVVLDEEDLASAEPKASRAIEVLRAVPREAVDPAWYDRPYFLGPDGSRDDYFALAQALEASGRVAIARWVMRRKRQLGALAAREGRLALVTLHPASEVIDAGDVKAPRGATFSQAERKLAEQLVAALEGAFDPSELRDDYRERVLKLIAAKRRGRRFVVEEAGPPRTRGDLGDALRRSLRAVKGGGRAAA